MREGDSAQSPSASSSPATDFSVALLTQLVRNGLRHIVLSPGSRSQALALVAAELERIGSVELHVRIDERVGGFLALGLAAETGLPSVVITTSGTATANLHPAVLEASHSNVPMIVLTADRPTELRGIRSNQTTVQTDLYGSAVRLSRDVEAPQGSTAERDAATGLARHSWRTARGLGGHNPGPVHLNLAFREPLSAAAPDLSGKLGEHRADQVPDAGASAATVTGVVPAVIDAPTPALLDVGPRTIVIAGNGAGERPEQLARDAGWPLIAEVSSGSRFGPNLVVAYRRLLADADFGGAVERAVVFGQPTLSREVPALLSRPEVDVIVVDPGNREFYNPGRRARQVSEVRLDGAVDPTTREARAWVGRWVHAGRELLAADDEASADRVAPDLEAGRSHDAADRLAFARAEFDAVRAPITRRMLAEAVWRFTWPHDRLVFGASRMVRDADMAVTGKKIPVHSNRGLAGIDGTISTAIGIALGSQVAAETAEEAGRTGTTRVLLGDLTLLHDVGALLFGEGERRPIIQVIVGNDGGGTIFDALEVAASAGDAAMRRVMRTPQSADIAALAAAYDWTYARATTRGELDQALSAPPAGPSILEVPLTP